MEKGPPSLTGKESSCSIASSVAASPRSRPATQPDDGQAQAVAHEKAEAPKKVDRKEPRAPPRASPERGWSPPASGCDGWGAFATAAGLYAGDDPKKAPKARKGASSSDDIEEGLEPEDQEADCGASPWASSAAVDSTPFGSSPKKSTRAATKVKPADLEDGDSFNDAMPGNQRRGASSCTELPLPRMLHRPTSRDRGNHIDYNERLEGAISSKMLNNVSPELGEHVNVKFSSEASRKSRRSHRKRSHSGPGSPDPCGSPGLSERGSISSGGELSTRRDDPADFASAWDA